MQRIDGAKAVDDGTVDATRHLQSQTPSKKSIPSLPQQQQKKKSTSAEEVALHAAEAGASRRPCSMFDHAHHVGDAGVNGMRYASCEAEMNAEDVPELELR